MVAASVSGMSQIVFPNPLAPQPQHAAAHSNPLLSMAAASVSGMSVFPDGTRPLSSSIGGGTEGHRCAPSPPILVPRATHCAP
jgi:hypothetical protein